MRQALFTTASAAHRTISVTYDDTTECFALFRMSSGDVFWRLDEFRDAADPAGSPRWSASHGRLSVGEVVRRLPQHAATVRGWTRKEIALGSVVADDAFAAITRDQALNRLSREIEEAGAATFAD